MRILTSSSPRLPLGAVVATLLLSSLVSVTEPMAAQAASNPSPVQPAPASMVTADGLPTVQIDGVVWSQAIVGNTVYAGGKFANARPAGAAAGTNLTPRNNLLAYNLTTGALITTFAPNLNAQVLAVAASPDGSRIYVAGDFTTANGLPRSRVAAYSTATGALISTFSSGVTSQVKAIVATNDTVYVGGSFTSSGQTPRSNLAAFRASDGALLGWNPSADYIVWALALSSDGRSVLAGGSFQNVGGSPAYGLAKIDAASGALQPWNAANTVRNAGNTAGITSLTVDGSKVYGTTYHFGPGGNLEGPFKADVATGNVEWVVDCHGDTYDTHVQGGIVYSLGHPHYCGNVGGGFPQTPQWSYQHTMAFTTGATGTHEREALGYPNWEGFPSPSIVNWLPQMAIGSASGQYQAGWTVTGNADYTVVGGEFPSVNGVGQQGLVRFAKKPIAPAKQGPLFTGGQFLPTLVATSPTSVRIAWQTGFDRDDYNLTYQVIRNGAFGSPIHTTTAGSNHWTQPMLGYVDTGRSPGTAYSYQLVARDDDGNVVYGGTASITMPASVPQSAYAAQVIQDGATTYWPLDEPSGTAVLDKAGPNHAVALAGVTRGTAGIIAGETASTLQDSATGRVYSKSTIAAPNEFTIQAWIKTSTTRGGRILGFSDLRQGNSGHRGRHLYMDNSGRINFGVRNSNIRTVTSSGSFRDDQWHQVVGTLGAGGMNLYVDGIRVGQRTDTTGGENYLGYWRLGGDNLSGWTNDPTSDNFGGAVDEVSIYPTVLSQTQIVNQWVASGRTSLVPNVAPTAAFTSSTNALKVDVDGSGSSDSDGTIVSYAWDFGDGGSATGATASRTYAAAGTYAVKLTVTDDKGATNSITKQVTVTAPAPAGPHAADTFERNVTGGLGTADVGGAWSHIGNAPNVSASGGKANLNMSAAGNGPSVLLNEVSAADVDAIVDVSIDKLPTGNGFFGSLIVRRISTSDYRANVRLTPTATILQISRIVSGTETVIVQQTISGLTYQLGDVLRLRLQARGSGTTSLSAKVWKVGTAEPAAWQLTTTDTASVLQNPGGVGLKAYLSGSSTNAPVVASFDNLSVVPIP